jgi:hypothetical protein
MDDINIFDKLEYSARMLDESIEQLIGLLNTKEGRALVMTLLTPERKQVKDMD